MKKISVGWPVMLGLVIGFLAAAAIGPLAIIWALNTLFGLTIEYTFWTWLAVVLLTGAFGKLGVTYKKNG